MHPLRLPALLTLAAASGPAAAQPPTGTLAADPEHGRILAFTMSGGSRTVVFAEGPPLVRPVALSRGLLVCDAGAGAVFLLNHWTGAVERTVVAPGAGGLIEPVGAAYDPDEGYHVLVLDGHDGTVRRYVTATGGFVGIAVAGRGRASGLMTAQERAPWPRQWVGRLFIAYPDLGEVACFDAPTGALLTIAVRGPGSAWALGPDNSGLIAEDRPGPFATDAVYSAEESGSIRWSMDLPPGTDPRGVSASFYNVVVSTAAGIVSFAPGSPPILFAATPGHAPADLHRGGCYANCDTGTGPASLDIFDFLCFQESFARADPYACGCDTTTGPEVCDLLDFLCFQNWFEFACP